MVGYHIGVLSDTNIDVKLSKGSEVYLSSVKRGSLVKILPNNVNEHSSSFSPENSSYFKFYFSQKFHSPNVHIKFPSVKGH